MNIRLNNSLTPYGIPINAIILAIAAFSSGALADVKEVVSTPAISGYGKIHVVNDVKSPYAISPHAVSKLAFKVSEGVKNPASINPALEKVARAINLLVADGVPTDHMNVAILIGGSSADVALNNSTYRKMFGIDNPNTDLLQKLHAAGAAIVVSDQALMTKNLDHGDLANFVSTALSSFTAITSLEQAGYSLASL